MCEMTYHSKQTCHVLHKQYLREISLNKVELHVITQLLHTLYFTCAIVIKRLTKMLSLSKSRMLQLCFFV